MNSIDASVDHHFEIDQFASQPTKTPATSYRMLPGGMAANAAMAMAKLGAPVTLLGRVGDDAAGVFVRDAVQACDVQTQLQGARAVLVDPRWCDGSLAALQWAKAHNALGVQVAMVTLGERGVLWTRGQGLHSLPAFAVTAVDTTGAGDVFHAALTWALSSTHDEISAIRFASAAAALKCTQRHGVMGTPSRAEVEQYLLLNK